MDVFLSAYHQSEIELQHLCPLTMSRLLNFTIKHIVCPFRMRFSWDTLMLCWVLESESTPGSFSTNSKCVDILEEHFDSPLIGLLNEFGLGCQHMVELGGHLQQL